MILSRRRFFGLLAAPAIVRASSIMPISAWTEPAEEAPAEEALIYPFGPAYPPPSDFLREYWSRILIAATNQCAMVEEIERLPASVNNTITFRRPAIVVS